MHLGNSWFDSSGGAFKEEKMKVYVITSGYYSDYKIRAVSLDRSEAEKICATFNNDAVKRGWGEICEIEEYDTENTKISAEKEVKIRYMMREHRHNKGIAFIEGGYFVFDDVNKIEKKKYIDDGENVERYDITATFPKDTPKEKAQKIMLDRLAEYMAKEEEIS